ncbi:MAG TPA: alpha/beta family hydrolase [Dermatophilaceae bacterium]
MVGGRSSGARVACRTAQAVGVDAVLALAFPLHPPGKPDRSRAAEAHLVTGVGTRLAVIQGEKDPFGSPEDLRSALGSSAEVISVRGNHSFTGTPTDVLEIARAFLSELLVPRDASSRVPPPQLVGSPDHKGERQNHQHLP